VGFLADASSVANAVAFIESSEPNVVLIDPGPWTEGGRHSLHALSGLRARTAWFLIAVHAAREDVDAAEALELGADLCLLKGLRTSELLAAVIRGLEEAVPEPVPDS
jgi:DNA-binding response OmpR family regulator